MAFHICSSAIEILNDVFALEAWKGADGEFTEFIGELYVAVATDSLPTVLHLNEYKGSDLFSLEIDLD